MYISRFLEDTRDVLENLAEAYNMDYLGTNLHKAKSTYVHITFRFSGELNNLNSFNNELYNIFLDEYDYPIYFITAKTDEDEYGTIYEIEYKFMHQNHY